MRIPALRLTGIWLSVLGLGLLSTAARTAAESVVPVQQATATAVPAYGGMLIPGVLAPGLLTGEPIGCVQAPQDRRFQQKRRHSRLFGWLYRSVRNVDVEKGTAPPLLFYLRSPLLAGFADEADCPPEQGVREPERCATVVAYAEKDEPRTIDVALPLLEATSTNALLETVRAHLDSGETVVLPSLDGREYVLAPARVHAVDVRSCAPPDAGDEIPLYG